MLVVANGTSQLLKDNDPSNALALNPFQTDARVNELSPVLDAAVPGAPLADLEHQARAIVADAPADARGYALMGELYDLKGQSSAAEALYHEALGRSGTESHALSKLLVRAVSARHMAEAVDYIDPLLRRWPSAWGKVASTILPIALSTDGGPRLMAAMRQNPPWRGGVLNLLSNSPAIGQVEQLLISEASSPAGAGVGDVSTVLNALIANQAYDQAYTFFLSTLPAAAKPLAGYVFDGAFAATDQNFYFGWNIRTTPDADISVDTADGEQGLKVSFIDAPARLNNVAETVYLPEGRYNLSAEISANNLTAPGKLFWNLSCSGAAPLLAQLQVPVGTYQHRSVDVTFDVPEDACRMPQLRLLTGTDTATQRERYIGDVTFHALSIKRS